MATATKATTAKKAPAKPLFDNPDNTETVAKKAPTKKKAKPVTATIYAKNKSVLFEGLKEDAEEFLRNNFPRVHSGEAEPDFEVVTKPGNVKLEMPPGHPDPDAVTDDDDDDDE